MNTVEHPSGHAPVPGTTQGKVFCIGFQKTGTTSLANALSHLGFRVTGPNGVNDPDIADTVRPLAKRLIQEYDAFQDNPWPILYRDVDAWCPGSKFILTLRSGEAWIKSLKRHFGEGSTPMREWIYGVGSPAGNEAVYLARFENHNKEVLEYFQERPDDLLVMHVTDGDGWEKLCPFLGKTVPDLPFPHENEAGAREKWMRDTGRFGVLHRILGRLRSER